MLLKYRPYIKIDMMGVSPVALLLSSHPISILQAKQIYLRLQGGSKSSLRKPCFLPPKNLKVLFDLVLPKELLLLAITRLLVGSLFFEEVLE